MTHGTSRRLLIFIHSLGGGGAERVAANLANYWADRGWRIVIVTLAPRAVDAYELHPAVERRVLNLAGDSANPIAGLWQNMRRVMALRRELRQFRPESALALMTSANVLLALAAKGLSVRTVGSEHVHPPQYPLGWMWERLRRYTYGGLYGVTALTFESANWLRRHTRARRVAVIPNPVSWPLPVGQPQVPPTSVSTCGRKLLVAAGRLEAEKGFDLLLQAFARLAQQYSNWDLAILGEGSMRSMLGQQIRTLNLENRVFLPGRVGNIGAWYACADLYVMSSRHEGFGNTLAEALASGLPAVSFDCEAGPRSIIRHETDGLLVPPADVGVLAHALERLMGDPAFRSRLAERAVEARERFAIEHIAGLWEDLFDEVS